MTNQEWEKVDHSVLLVGWGVDQATGEKFWLVQNTWGSQWGENGYFRIRRGTDESAIESTCEAGTPIIVDNKTNLHLIPNLKNRDLIRVSPLNQPRLNLFPTQANSSILKISGFSKLQKNGQIVNVGLPPFLNK